ncbi:hypothetical protein FISHEDRAFT_74021 [Fistulina hepatica ATCC 64428]|uniref:Uncharacterized protein n=1 Tax=Fistulina hepatica ATCC 64428 TaxID=1128425 RepID=A0A0D7AC90_9AGAR|nr:hypothetical protein FISHEDRAFT_74021 [Fistulina hepatica ATCC 64428]
MSNSTTVKVVTLPKRKADGSNWMTYKERFLNNITKQGLCAQLAGRKVKPGEPEIHTDGKTYLPSGSKPLSDEEADAAWEKADEWAQNEAKIREVIYETVDQTTFMQIKNEPTAAKMWQALAKITEGRGDTIKVDTLARLQTMRCTEGDNIPEFIGRMTTLREDLAAMGSPVEDTQFASIIRLAFSSLTAEFKSSQVVESRELDDGGPRENGGNFKA